MKTKEEKGLCKCGHFESYHNLGLGNTLGLHERKKKREKEK